MHEGWSGLLHKKTVIVTGASSGIGRECALQCSREGATVVLVGRNRAQLEATLSKLSGPGHYIVPCDLCDSQQVKNMAADIMQHGPVDGLLHCAGIQKTTPLRAFDAQAFDDIFHTNVSAAIELTRAVTSPKIFNKSGGALVFVSSVVSVKPEKGKLEYAATKAALNSAVKTMASELAARFIRVNAVLPAMVQTPILESMFAELPEESVDAIRKRHLLGILDPADIADLCVFLVSDRSKRITGEHIVIDSGYTLA